jgi:hypothetical protein
MNAWLDTETKAILQRSPPEKLAPPDTATFALVLLTVQRASRDRLVAAVERVREVTRDEAAKVLTQPLPAVVKRGLSYEDAVLGQFEFIACDAISIFLADEVVTDAPEGYLGELYADVSHSAEFELVSVRIESMPADAKGREFLNRFVGVLTAQFPLELTGMRKKARIMEHWAAKIGGRVVVGKEMT